MANNPFASGSLNVDGAEVTLTRDSDGSYTIERTFVPEELRHQGLARKALEYVVSLADKYDIKLNAQVHPDDFGKDPDYFTKADALKRMLEEFGFAPLEMDGEVYRNDLSRVPQ